VCGVRLVEPESGVLRIDGVDVRAMGLKDLRTHMGVIPQDPVLFKVGQANPALR
jgi:ATP-binding cassette subfamily C (CFTR/MRP) protein 1